MSYFYRMKVFRWNNEKNEWLNEKRGVSFEQVVMLMEREDILEIVDHPNRDKYPEQKIATVWMNDYAYLVPYAPDGEIIFLKTIIPSRKATNKYVRTKK
jgi:uncharacterized DUF497 family protein